MVQALLLLLIHHLVDVCTDCVCGDGLKRTYSQAWFSRIYIEVVSDAPSDELGIVEERTPVAEALDGVDALESSCETLPIRSHNVE